MAPFELTPADIERTRIRNFMTRWRRPRRLWPGDRTYDAIPVRDIPEHVLQERSRAPDPRYEDNIFYMVEWLREETNNHSIQYGVGYFTREADERGIEPMYEYCIWISGMDAPSTAEERNKVTQLLEMSPDKIVQLYLRTSES